MNRDFSDMLKELSATDAEFLVVGAYALACHGLPRATGDIDIWVRPEPQNAKRVYRALAAFGAPLRELTEADLLNLKTIYQIGVVPSRIDILTSIDGVEFEEAWRGRWVFEVEGMRVKVISREHLIQNKRAVGRPKDLADLAWLESH